MKECFDCHTNHMMLIKCSYDDLYERIDGEEKERLICLSCLSRR